MIILILAVIVFFGAVWFLLTGLTVQQKEIAVTMRKAKAYGIRDQREIETRRSVNERVLGPMTDKLAALTMRLIPNTNPNQIHNRLMAAGLGQSMTPQMFMAIKGGLIAVSVGGGLLLAMLGLVLVAGGPLAGPDRQRARIHRAGLLPQLEGARP